MVKKNNRPKESVEVRERPIKSVVKAITWRLVASGTTFILALFFFHDDPYATEKAGGIAGAEAIIKMVLYFLHERAWNVVRWGKMRVYVRHYNMIRRRVVRKMLISLNSSVD